MKIYTILVVLFLPFTSFGYAGDCGIDFDYNRGKEWVGGVLGTNNIKYGPNPSHTNLICNSVLNKGDIYSNYSHQDCADIVQQKAPSAVCSSLGYNVDLFTGQERGKRCYACYRR